MRVSLVVAAAKNGVIGLRGKIPWRLPDDQQFFKKLTVGHCVVMGRKTFESLPRPLPDRKTLVLSRKTRRSEAGAEGDAGDSVETAYLSDLTAALDQARAEGFKECFIAGGEAVYRESMASADRIYLTRIEAELEGDTHFPEIDEARWHCVERERHPVDDRHKLPFVFETWDRVE